MKKSLLLFMFLLLIAACGGAAADPAATVERYLQAKVDQDRELIQQLLCAELESVLEREATTFASVTGVTIEDMACVTSVENDEQASVGCNGMIVADYGTEQTTFPLVAYRTVLEDGEWKWCGETIVPQ